MTRTVIALYDEISHASAAVRELVDNGFSRDDISLMASDASGDYRTSIGDERVTGDTSGAAEGAGVGAGIGAALGGIGGLLIGLGALTIPGIGPVVAAGPLAAALTGLAGAGAGAVAGGVTGGMLGALVDMGVPESNAQYYAEGVRRGGHLVSVRTADHLSDRAVEIMNRHDPIDLNERVNTWRQSGWSGFEESEMDRGPLEPGEMAPSHMERSAETEWPRETTYHSTDISTDFGDFTDYEDRFRTHFANSTYAGTYTYEQYQPAYRYGYELATDDRYRDRDWMDLETEAHQRWEEENPGTWEEFKAAVRHAWAEIKDAVD